MFDLPETCRGCLYHKDKSSKHNGHSFDKCIKHAGYLDVLHKYRFDKKGCPDSTRLTKIKDTWLWLRMYRKGIEKEYIPLDAEGKEKALVRANWFVMRIAYTADWFIKRYDKRMEQRRLAYRIRQSINNYISIE